MRQQPSPIFSFLSFFFSLLLVTRIENCSLELPSGKYVIVGSGSSPFAPDKVFFLFKKRERGEKKKKEREERKEGGGKEKRSFIFSLSSLF